MSYHAIAISGIPHRRQRTAQRAFTLAPVVPSQDATRYQARNMPKPKYDLERKNQSVSLLGLLLRIYSLLVT